MHRLTVLLLAAAFGAAACGGPTPSQARQPSGMDDMRGMAMAPAPSPVREATPHGNGLSSSANGYALVLSADGLSFRITGPGGHTVTRYQPYQSELMQFDVVRSDLTGYRHVDAAMHQDGTWVVTLPGLSPGAYRGYATFAAPDASAGTPRVYQLSGPFTVPGHVVDAALPAVATSATVGGYRVTVAGQPKAGVSLPLRLHVTSNGKPVPYFQRYLDGYAHLTAFHAGDLAYAHLSPATRDGSDLTAQALFPESGAWRLFVRFQTTGAPLTAEFTIEVS